MLCRKMTYEGVSVVSGSMLRLRVRRNPYEIDQYTYFKLKKYTFSLFFIYFSEIYLKLYLSILDLYLEKVYIYESYICALRMFSLFCGTGLIYTSSVHNFQNTSKEETGKQQMLLHVIEHT